MIDERPKEEHRTQEIFRGSSRYEDEGDEQQVQHVRSKKYNTRMQTKRRENTGEFFMR